MPTNSSISQWQARKTRLCSSGVYRGEDTRAFRSRSVSIVTNGNREFTRAAKVLLPVPGRPASINSLGQNLRTPDAPASESSNSRRSAISLLNVEGREADAMVAGTVRCYRSTSHRCRRPGWPLRVCYDDWPEPLAPQGREGMPPMPGSSTPPRRIPSLRGATGP